MSATLLRDIIVRDLGQDAYAQYANYQVTDLDLMVKRQGAPSPRSPRCLATA